jgi:hypothetical protein
MRRLCGFRRRQHKGGNGKGVCKCWLPEVKLTDLPGTLPRAQRAERVCVWERMNVASTRGERGFAWEGSSLRYLAGSAVASVNGRDSGVCRVNIKLFSPTLLDPPLLAQGESLCGREGTLAGSVGDPAHLAGSAAAGTDGSHMSAILHPSASTAQLADPIDEPEGWAEATTAASGVRWTD